MGENKGDRGALFSVTGPEAMGTNWNTGNSIWTHENLFLLWEWWNTGIVSPERLWSLHPWRQPKTNGTWPWETLAYPVLPGAGVDKLQRCPPTSTMLRLHEAARQVLCCKCFDTESIWTFPRTLQDHSKPRDVNEALGILANWLAWDVNVLRRMWRVGTLHQVNLKSDNLQKLFTYFMNF